MSPQTKSDAAVILAVPDQRQRPSILVSVRNGAKADILRDQLSWARRGKPPRIVYRLTLPMTCRRSGYHSRALYDPQRFGPLRSEHVRSCELSRSASLIVR